MVRRKGCERDEGRMVRSVVALLLAGLLVFAPASRAIAAIGEKKALVIPLYVPKSDSDRTTRTPNNIRANYRDTWEAWWAETSYGQFTVDTKTFGYQVMPWPMQPLPGATSGPDMSTPADGSTATGTGEVVNPLNDAFGDGIFTPGERFLDLNEDGSWSDAEDFTDIDSDFPEDDFGNGFWDESGEFFGGLNDDGRYDSSVTIIIYDANEVVNGGTPSTDLPYTRADGSAANWPVTVDEWRR